MVLYMLVNCDKIIPFSKSRYVNCAKKKKNIKIIQPATIYFIHIMYIILYICIIIYVDTTYNLQCRYITDTITHIIR
jgi:hypothetical protein